MEVGKLGNPRFATFFPLFQVGKLEVGKLIFPIFPVTTRLYIIGAVVGKMRAGNKGEYGSMEIWKYGNMGI